MRSPAVLYSYHESTLELSHCFPDQWVTLWPCSAHLHFLCDCSHGGIVHVRAQSQNGRYEMFTRLAVWCLSLVFPTETHQGFLPEQVMEVLLLQGGGGFISSRSLRWFPSPAVVWATFPVPQRGQPVQTIWVQSMPLCTFVVWGGCSLANSCLEIANLDVSIFILVF